MKKSIGINLAVPKMGLLQLNDESKLAFDTNFWTHLNRYVGRVENLPKGFDSGSAPINEALELVRSEVKNFGSPGQLRQLVQENPNALAEEQPPVMLYANIVWLVQRLQGSTSSIVSTLQGLVELTGSCKDTKVGLQTLGRQAQDARTAISPLKDSLKKFKTGILPAHTRLSDAFKADAEVLHQAQEEVGGLQVKIKSVQDQIEELGILGFWKKKDLQEQLDSLKQELESKSQYAEKLRAAFGKLEPLMNEGQWLKSGVDDLMDFLDKAREVWTAFGSDMMQLIADSSDTQLEDSAWLKKVLGLDEAIKKWKAIDQAAKGFTVQSLVDFQND